MSRSRALGARGIVGLDRFEVETDQLDALWDEQVLSCRTRSDYPLGENLNDHGWERVMLQDSQHRVRQVVQRGP
jgi:hypothetical protein